MNREIMDMKLGCYLRILLLTCLSAQALDTEKISTVVDYLGAMYIEDTSHIDMTESALTGIFSKLDSHSQYLPREEALQLKSLTVGEFIGIGITVSLIDDELIVQSVTPNSPASRAGIEPGSIITHINSNPINPADIYDNIENLRGEVNTQVNITLLKNPKAPIILTRQAIDFNELHTYDLSPNVGYIALNLFNDDTDMELLTALDSHRDKKAIVIDLRNNPGGLLLSAIHAALQFVDGREVSGNIAYIQQKNIDIPVPIPSSARDILQNKPIYVLIGPKTASGAELFAAALKFHKRAIIIGETSFGKGSIQSLIPLADDSAIKITTAYFATPDNQAIQSLGVSPDVYLDTRNSQVLNQVLTTINQ